MLRSVRYLMERWGVSRPTVYKAIRRGNLVAIKIEGALRVADEAIEAYEQKGKERVDAGN